jgi:hypothetical protein
MPIIVDKKPTSIQDLHELYEKREKRNARRTKYKLIRTSSTLKEVKSVKLIIDGVEFDISKVSKSLLEQLLAFSDVKE